MGTRRPTPTERGHSMVGTTAGLLVFLILLLFAVQASVSLSARSLVTAAAYDAARDVAGYSSEPSRAAARERAEQRLRERLGEAGAGMVVEWIDPANPDLVQLRVVVEHPSILPSRFGDPLGVTETDRIVEVRVERWQP